MKYIKSINVIFGKGKSAIGQLHETNGKYYICDIPLEDKFIEISKELHDYIKKLRGY